MLLWTLGLAVLLGMIVRQDLHEHRTVALAEAKALFQKDLVFRLWNSDQGGIYVPATDKVQPNPYLAHVPGRDVMTTSGLRLTLVNPAYMTRMVHELGASEFGMKGHITSLNPIRPANGPDPWERRTLQRFEQGVREVDEVAPLNGVPHLRYMGALVTQERCLKCHASQGYRVGDVRGGISVSIPTPGLTGLALLRQHTLLLGGFALLWAVGLGAIGLLFARTGERQSALDAHAEVEAQLHQSQKLEAVGQLAGGVAHDINNMLTVILGHAELLRHKLGPHDARLHHVEATEKAAARSRGIVAQLLAFSRKTVPNPVVLDLEPHLAELARTLAPLIGEQILLRVTCQPGLWKIRFDPSQLDQIVMNLVLNARDAMPGGGTVTIAAVNLQLDAAFRDQHLEAEPGPHVLLTVHDHGCGMDRATAARVFEPFFTTKGPGQGTGLGLATVFGIVRQAKGFITVYSEPGRGTDFKVYLPVFVGDGLALAQAPAPAVLPAAGKVLLVEDDESLRVVIAQMLEALGQEVQVAASGREALLLAAEASFDAQLLLTDMVMPGMGGLELRDRIRELRPGLRVTLMSGYATEAILSQVDRAEGLHILQKPFSSAELARELAGA
jgi:signal transduction histidine kinase